MKKNKGFTLIELLAVIIILAAIALIIAPLALDIIREQQKKTFKESLNGILRSSRLEIVNSGLSFPATFTYSDGKLLSPTGKELKVTGKIPDGSVRYNGNGEPTTGDSKHIKSVVFPSGLETIGEHAVGGIYSDEIIFNEITNLDFSKAISLQTIGYGSFESNQLTSVKFGTIQRLTEIGPAAFCNEDGGTPTYDKIPDSVTVNKGFRCLL